MITANDPVETYLGNDTADEFAFNFKVRDDADILIMVFSTVSGALLWSERGDELDEVDDVYFNPLAGGGTITLPAPLPSGQKIVIMLAADIPVQGFQFREQTNYQLRQFEEALDNVMIYIQRMNNRFDRVFQLSDNAAGVAGLNMKIASMPVPNGIPIFNDDGDAIEFITPDELVSSTGGFVDTDYAYVGYSARFSEAFSSTDLDDTLTKILNISYLAPLISLSGTGSGTIREKGASLASAPLTAAITKRSDPIAEVRFYRGVTLIDTQTSGGGIPNGGNSTYTDSTGWTDTISFSAQVDDDGSTGGPTTVTSNTVTYTFVYPYYYGADAAAISAAAVAALTKSVIVSTATVNLTITAAGGEVFYFAYPASYGALTSILDVNGFNTLPDWTLRTENITGLDGKPVSYRIYEFNNPVTAGDYYYSFRR